MYKQMSDDPAYDIEFQENPTEYEIGRAEQDAFKLQPYESELLPVWGIKTLHEAGRAATDIYQKFEEYNQAREFVGMDMARKYLQMGWTRSLRYGKYPGGRKYESGEERGPQEWYDEENVTSHKCTGSILRR
ncbi:MAG: hypothetical protein J07HQX50_01005 [Haloquadratum sp. J07HQX50]|nr:MAG: hypothetical protein J07HQX50_01005 [Haloquadratum sp. J07HQX50]